MPYVIKNCFYIEDNLAKRGIIMIPIRHSLRNGVRVIIIAFSYVLIQVALWFVFGFIYYKETGNKSITSFLTSELGNDSGLYVKFCFELFMALVNALVGAWLAKTLLQSRGYIQIDDYCVYRKNSGFIFRYWAVLPKGKYLYNVSIQLRLTSDELNRTGVNRLGTYWDSDSAVEQSVYKLQCIRGDRFLYIEDEDAKNLKQAIMCHKSEWDKLYFLFTVYAELNDGSIIRESKIYRLNEKLLIQYMFAPTNQNKFTFKLYKDFVKANSPVMYREFNRDSFFFCHTENAGCYYSNNLTVKELGEINNNKPHDKVLLRTEEVILGKNYRLRFFRNWLSEKVIIRNKNFNSEKLVRSYCSVKRSLQNSDEEDGDTVGEELAPSCETDQKMQTKEE